MALGKIRRWNVWKSGDGSIWQFRRWGAVFFHDFNNSIFAFRRWLLRESLLKPEDVARRKTPVVVWIVGADVVDQAQFLQRGEVVVESGDGHFRIFSQPSLRRKTAEIRVVSVAEKLQLDLGGRLQPALLNGPVGGGVAHGRSPEKEKGPVMNIGPDRVGRGRKRLGRAVPWQWRAEMVGW